MVVLDHPGNGELPLGCRYARYEQFLVQVNERVYQSKTIKSLLSSIIDGERLGPQLQYLLFPLCNKILSILNTVHENPRTFSCEGKCSRSYQISHLMYL